MIGSNQSRNAHTHNLNPNYAYDDDRNSIPMDATSGSGIHIGTDERRTDGSSPHHRHYGSRDFVEQHDGKGEGEVEPPTGGVFALTTESVP